MMRLKDLDRLAIEALLSTFGLRLVETEAGKEIPGSYWGESEAGLVGAELHARADTPVHSVLHETSHYVCMSGERRASLFRDAGGDDLEECAVCYLQILIGDSLCLDRERLFQEMDRWGYSFRAGSTKAWFETDAEDARAWLAVHQIPSSEWVSLGERR
jgi:hypothetical protein